jgi:hypothetical protein
MTFEITDPKLFPLKSLQTFLIPDQLLSLKLFYAESLDLLELKVNDWVSSTKSIIAVPGVVSISADMFYVTLSYVPSSEGIQDDRS